MKTLFILSIAVLFFVLASLQVDGKRHILEDFAGQKMKVISVSRQLIAKDLQSNANKVNLEVNDDSNESYSSSGSDLGSSSQNHHRYPSDQKPLPTSHVNPKIKVTSVGRQLIAKNRKNNPNKVFTDGATEKSTNGRIGPEVDDDSNESYGSSGTDMGSSSENHHSYPNDQRPSPKKNDDPKKKVASTGRQLIEKDLQNNQNEVNTEGDEDSNESFGSSGSGLGSSSVNHHYFTNGRKPQNPRES